MAFEHLFAVNGTWLYPPDNYAETNTPIIAYNLLGSPVRQSYPSIIFTWSFLKQEHITALMAVFDPENPAVTVSFIEKDSGALITRYAYIEEPVVGGRAMIFYSNVACRFTRLRETL